MNGLLALAFLVGPMGAVPAAAQEVQAGDLTITGAYAIETAPSAMSGAGYLTISNEGDSSDTLVEIRGDFPQVRLHTTEVENGVARMVPVASIEIAPGQSVTMQPGGMHVMFMGLDGDPFEAGEKVTATVVFEKAGEVEVPFEVMPRDAAPAATDARADMDGDDS